MDEPPPCILTATEVAEKQAAIRGFRRALGAVAVIGIATILAITILMLSID